MREARAHPARVHEPPIVVVVADEERADTLSRAFGLGEAADHELLAEHTLHLLPARVALGPLVARLAPLRDDPLEPHGTSLAMDRRPVAHDVRRVANDAVLFRAHDFLEPGFSFLEGELRKVF